MRKSLKKSLVVFVICLAFLSNCRPSFANELFAKIIGPIGEVAIKDLTKLGGTSIFSEGMGTASLELFGYYMAVATATTFVQNLTQVNPLIAEDFARYKLNPGSAQFPFQVSNHFLDIYLAQTRPGGPMKDVTLADARNEFMLGLLALWKTIEGQEFSYGMKRALKFDPRSGSVYSKSTGALLEPFKDGLLSRHHPLDDILGGISFLSGSAERRMKNPEKTRERIEALVNLEMNTKRHEHLDARELDNLRQRVIAEVLADPKLTMRWLIRGLARRITLNLMKFQEVFQQQYIRLIFELQKRILREFPRILEDPYLSLQFLQNTLDQLDFQLSITPHVENGNGDLVPEGFQDRLTLTQYYRILQIMGFGVTIPSTEYRQKVD